MQTVFLVAGIVLMCMMFLSMFRALIGPTVLDRVVGVNVIGTKTTVLLLIIGILYRDLEMFVDIALAYALLNFIASLAATKFFLRRERPPEDEQTAAKEVS